MSWPESIGRIGEIAIRWLPREGVELRQDRSPLDRAAADGEG
jgi:hypothetical protein